MPGPIPDHEIERVAHRICEELGISPTEFISARRGDTMTRVEERYHSYVPIHAEGHQLPAYLDQWGNKVVPPLLQVASIAAYPMNEPVNVQRWQTFRRDAEAAIAGWRAVHHYMLLET